MPQIVSVDDHDHPRAGPDTPALPYHQPSEISFQREDRPSHGSSFASHMIANPNNPRRESTKPRNARNLVPYREHDREAHPIAQGLQEEQQGRSAFLLAVPLAVTGFVVYYNPVSLPLAARLALVALAVGYSTAIWNSTLLRRTCPRVSAMLELLGTSFILVAVFGYLSCHLPKGFLWLLPLLCFVVSLVLLGIALFSRAKSLPYDGGDVPARTAFDLA